MPRHVYIQRQPEPGFGALTFGQGWERVGHVSAFAERRLWRVVMSELGVLDGGREATTANSVDFHLIADRAALWETDSDDGRYVDTMMALDPYGDGRIMLYSRGPMRHFLQPSHRRPAPRLDQDGAQVVLPMELSKHEGTYFFPWPRQPRPKTQH